MNHLSITRLTSADLRLLNPVCSVVSILTGTWLCCGGCCSCWTIWTCLTGIPASSNAFFFSVWRICDLKLNLKLKKISFQHFLRQMKKTYTVLPLIWRLILFKSSQNRVIADLNMSISSSVHLLLILRIIY